MDINIIIDEPAPLPPIMKNSLTQINKNVVISDKYIRWIKKTSDDCLLVCTRMDGCSDEAANKVCTYTNLDAFNKYNKYFSSSSS